MNLEVFKLKKEKLRNLNLEILQILRKKVFKPGFLNFLKKFDT